MWSDTLLALERDHLVRFSAWAAGSFITGTLLLVWLVVRRRTVPLLTHFALQLAAWGVIELIIAATTWRRLSLRDYSSAMRLQHTLWFNSGLDLGFATAGVTLIVACFYLGRKMGGVGAGLGIIVQAFALLLLNVQLLTLIGPVR